MPRPSRGSAARRGPSALPSAACLALALVACGPVGDFGSDDPGLRESPGVFRGSFLALSDADMAATAYADGGLEPLPGARDALTWFRDGEARTRHGASNSVISWPQVVDVSPDGRFAYVVETRGPAPPDVERREDVYTGFPTGQRLTVLALREGRFEPVDVANRRVQFYRLGLDAERTPISVRRLGPPTPDLGRRLSVGKWTPDGRHLASLDMERTYLPELAFLTAWEGRRRYSLSLVRREPGTGVLEEIDRVAQAGLLPEDVIFDREGRPRAVAVFHRRRGEDRRRGFVDFFSVGPDGTLASRGVTQAVPRGAHDLVRLP